MIEITHQQARRLLRQGLDGDFDWSPGGRWLAFSSDGGLYLLDWQAARRGDAVPLLISREKVYEVDWKWDE